MWVEGTAAHIHFEIMPVYLYYAVCVCTCVCVGEFVMSVCASVYVCDMPRYCACDSVDCACLFQTISVLFHSVFEICVFV